MKECEIQEICKSAIQLSVSCNSNPLHVVKGMLGVFIKNIEEINSIYNKCHEYMYANRESLSCIIEKPDKD